MIAFVLSEMACSISSTSMLKSAGSTSTNTASAPACAMANAVAANEFPAVITSSPRPMSKARNARWIASVLRAQIDAVPDAAVGCKLFFELLNFLAQNVAGAVDRVAHAS